MYYNRQLYHHGILGQKWGVRRYQNSDGTGNYLFAFTAEKLGFLCDI